MSAFDDLLKKLESATMEELALASTPRLKELLDVACPIFEQFHIADQLTALSFMFGIATSAIEGEITQFEQEHGEAMGFEERLQIFTTVARAVFTHAMKARTDFPAPSPVSPTTRIM